jgi:hypothetical protein
MTTPVDVANMSLDNIGARFSITSLNPPLPPPNAIVVARHYQPKIDALHRAAHWNCTRRQIGLTLLKAAVGTPENPGGTTLPIPPIPYQYEYAYPADCLKARYLIPNPPTVGSTSPPILGGGVMQNPIWNPPVGYKFAVAVDTDPAGNQIKVILTDLEFAQMVYTARIVNPDLWDPHFLAAGCATLGAWLVNPLARNAQVLKEQIEIASSIITQARISDGNEGVTTTDHDPDWMRVRGSSAYGFLNSPTNWYGWDSMGFPGGVLI